MVDLAEEFAAIGAMVPPAVIHIAGAVFPKRGRKPTYRDETGTVRAASNAEQLRKCRAGNRQAKLRHIAILDFETDPFDAQTKEEIFPFVCELYSDQFGSIVIWDDNFETFISKVVASIEALPDSYTIYAHNGGKFDYLFLVRHLRGIVKFKGRAIMVAKIGNHELRDSLHILPEKLAAWKKDHFDYSKMKRCNRAKFREEILSYLHSDCIYLFDIVKSFIAEFGLKLSIGQAAFTELKKSYKVSHVSEHTDDFMRRYFFGGRVECIAGRGVFDSVLERTSDPRTSINPGAKPYRLYDVNSMYPHVMANCYHPIGNEYNWRRGDIDENTCFVDIECDNRHGAFVSRTVDGMAAIGTGCGRFFVSVHEYRIAQKYSLIDAPRIVGVVDCRERTTFAKFIVPMYTRRQEVKRQMAALKKSIGENYETNTEYEELKKQDLFLKYLLNNSYGKFAQNPRKFKEYYYTDAGAMPEAEWMEFLTDEKSKLLTLIPNTEAYNECAQFIHDYSMPTERTDDFAIWSKPSPGRRFNNVGTAASITGAARAMLLEAQQLATDPIYCDTDSLICRELPVEISDTRLGAWKIEETFDRVIIAGKKEYACEVAGLGDGHERRLKVRCKGADLRVRPQRNGSEWTDAPEHAWRASNAATWVKYVSLIDGQIIEAINRAPTITKTGAQFYMRRKIRATAGVLQHAGKNVFSGSQLANPDKRAGRHSVRA